MPRQPKPILKTQVIPVFRVHYQDFEGYVQQVFGFDFDFFLATGTVPGLVPEYQVSGVIPLPFVPPAMRLRDGERSKNVALILNVLAEDKYIEPGQYVIDTKPKPRVSDEYRDLLSKRENPGHPDCIAFREMHKYDRVFIERAAILDEAARDLMQRGKQ